MSALTVALSTIEKVNANEMISIDIERVNWGIPTLKINFNIHKNNFINSHNKSTLTSIRTTLSTLITNQLYHP